MSEPTYVLGERGKAGVISYVMDFLAPAGTVSDGAPVHGHRWTKNPAMAQEFANKQAAHEYLVRLMQTIPRSRLEVIELPSTPSATEPAGECQRRLKSHPFSTVES